MLFPETMMDAAADKAACRELLRSGSRTFFAAAHLLPRAVREPATALYAFCRLADDAIDLGVDPSHPSPDGRGSTLDRLKLRLDRAYCGMPLPLAADRAFAAAVADHAIPRELPEALLEGLSWDAEGRRYETLADLQAYAARVAGSVGVMMALVMGVREPALTRACALGAAMQLTNIARDVGEDARAGRLYLPLSWMREAGLDPDQWLAAPTFGPAVAGLVRRLLDEADRLYAAGEAGIAALPSSCQIGIRAAGLLYAEIGHEVARRDYDSVSGRARVSTRRKLALLVAAATPRRRSLPADITMPDMSASAFLIACVKPVPASGKRPETLRDQMIWVLELFKRVERRRQAHGGA